MNVPITTAIFPSKKIKEPIRNTPVFTNVAAAAAATTAKYLLIFYESL